MSGEYVQNSVFTYESSPSKSFTSGSLVVTAIPALAPSSLFATAIPALEGSRHSDE
jgi:hypothetical protein